MKLLIVDDSVMIRRAIEKFSQGLGLEIVGQAGDGIQAVEMFKEHLPDCVTLDITMPKMDGLTALKQMLQIKPSARFLIASAITNQAVILDALTNGAKHYINKPFNEEEIQQALKKLML